MEVKRQRTTNFWYFRAAFKAIKWIFRSCYFKYWDEQIEYKEHNRELHFPLRIKKALYLSSVSISRRWFYIFSSAKNFCLKPAKNVCQSILGTRTTLLLFYDRQVILSICWSKLTWHAIPSKLNIIDLDASWVNKCI